MQGRSGVRPGAHVQGASVPVAGTAPARTLRYKMQINGELEAWAYFNLGSRFKLPFPHVVTRGNRIRAHFPAGRWDLVSVAHEGIHIGHWVVHDMLKGRVRALRPFVAASDMAWKHGHAKVREEAVARISDRWLQCFLRRAQAAGLDYRLSVHAGVGSPRPPQAP